MDIQTQANDLFSNSTAFIQLPDFYKKNGYEFKLKKRQGGVAIFGQYNEHRLLAYEVFEIRKQKAAEFHGTFYEAKERVPSNEEWGYNAFTVHSLERAEAYMEQILNDIAQREVKTSTV